MQYKCSTPKNIESGTQINMQPIDTTNNKNIITEPRAVITDIDVYTNGMDVIGNASISSGLKLTPTTDIDANINIGGDIDTKAIKIVDNKIELGFTGDNDLFYITNKGGNTTKNYISIKPSTGEMNVLGKMTISGKLNMQEFEGPVRITRANTATNTYIQPSSGNTKILFAPYASGTDIFRIDVGGNTILSRNLHEFLSEARFISEIRTPLKNNFQKLINYAEYNLVSVQDQARFIDTGIPVANFTVQPCGIISSFDVEEVNTDRRNDLWTYANNGTWFIWARKAWNVSQSTARVKVMIINNQLCDQTQSDGSPF